MYRISKYVLKRGKRIFRQSKAYSHGSYIRPNYVRVWREANRQADLNGVSLSEFVSQAVYYFLTGKRPPHDSLGGRHIVDIIRFNDKDN